VIVLNNTQNYPIMTFKNILKHYLSKSLNCNQV